MRQPFGTSGKVHPHFHPVHGGDENAANVIPGHRHGDGSRSAGGRGRIAVVRTDGVKRRLQGGVQQVHRKIDHKIALLVLEGDNATGNSGHVTVRKFQQVGVFSAVLRQQIHLQPLGLRGHLQPVRTGEFHPCRAARDAVHGHRGIFVIIGVGIVARTVGGLRGLGDINGLGNGKRLHVKNGFIARKGVENAHRGARIAAQRVIGSQREGIGVLGSAHAVYLRIGDFKPVILGGGDAARIGPDYLQR